MISIPPTSLLAPSQSFVHRSTLERPSKAQQASDTNHGTNHPASRGHPPKSQRLQRRPGTPTLEVNGEHLGLMMSPRVHGDIANTNTNVAPESGSDPWPNGKNRPSRGDVLVDSMPNLLCRPRLKRLFLFRQQFAYSQVPRTLNDSWRTKGLGGRGSTPAASTRPMVGRESKVASLSRSPCKIGPP